MKISVPIYQVDAFANKAFEGNPAAVCLVSSTTPELSDEVLQSIAAENNLSETAFVQPLAPPKGVKSSSENEFKDANRFKLRWFTPQIEVPLCGHATLASAAALFQCAGNTAETIFFETKSGELAVHRVKNKKGKADDSEKDDENTDSLKLAMNLPLLAPISDEEELKKISPDFHKHSDLVAAAIGVDPEYFIKYPPTTIGGSFVREILYEPTLRYLVIVTNGPLMQSSLEMQTPKIKAMQAAHTEGKLVGVIFTASAKDEDHDFYSRFYGPWAGIDEDPVTGSAHSVLGPYWAEQYGKTELKARQCSRRGGELEVSVDKEAGRVVVSGGAVVVIRGELLLDV